MEIKRLVGEETDACVSRCRLCFTMAPCHGGVWPWLVRKEHGRCDWWDCAALLCTATSWLLVSEQHMRSTGSYSPDIFATGCLEHGRFGGGRGWFYVLAVVLAEYILGIAQS